MKVEQCEMHCEYVKRYQRTVLKELNEILSDEEMTVWDREYVDVLLDQLANANKVILGTQKLIRDMIRQE